MSAGRNIVFIFIFWVGSIIPNELSGQLTGKPIPVDSTSRDSVVLAWLQNLYREGVTVVNDSVIISEETSRLLTDESYRELIYPATYTWDMVRFFIQKQDLRKAYWYMLNLYLADEKSKEMVVQFLLMYDRLFKMDKILVNTFYTYVLTDPEVGNVINGHFKVTAPHIMEKKLDALKEILYYLEKYKPKDRKEETEKKNQ